MSTQPTEASETDPQESNESEQQAAQPKPSETVDFWKQKAREQEKRAKENADAAKRLAELEDAQKSEAERVADRLAQAEKIAADAEAKVLRRELALEHKLTKEDAALLDTINDEDAMRALAERLAPAAEPAATARPPKPDANQGRPGTAGPTSTADSFAEFFKNSLPER